MTSAALRGAIRVVNAVPGFVRRHAAVVILAWVVLAVGLNIAYPQLERVVADRAPAFLDPNTQSGSAIDDMVKAFDEGGSNNNVYVALESPDRLDEADRAYYRGIVDKLRSEPAVTVVVDLWSDPVASGANESADREMAYVQVWLKGNMGDADSLRSVAAVENLVDRSSPPDGLNVCVTGPSAVIADEFHAADRDILIISAITFVVIFTLLLLVYRSLVTALMPLVSVGLALLVARAVISALGLQGWVSASMFASSISAALILGAGTGYSIFLIGRYQEARRKGLSPGAAYHASYRGVNHIVVASALTIAGACACLTFAQIGVLQTAGIPSAIGILVTLAAALTLTPALLTVLSKRGYLEPRAGTVRDRRWRRFGTAVVRWPIPTFLAAITLLGAITLILPTMRFSYDEVSVQPDSTTSVQGMRAFDRHFPPNQASPEFVTVTSDRDLRNPSDAIAIEEISRALARIPDVRSVLSLTRPTGRLLPESLLVSQASTVGLQLEQGVTLFDTRIADLRRADASLATMVAATAELQGELTRTAGAVQGAGGGTAQVAAGMKRLQESTAAVTRTLEPLRRTVRENPNCTGDAVCSATQAMLAAYDVSPVASAVAGIDQSATGAEGLAGSTAEMAARLRASALKLGATVEQLRSAQDVTTRFLGTADALRPQLDQASSFLREIGKNYGASDSGVFYLPEQVFSDPRFAVALRSTISSDGKTARFVIYGTSNAFGQGGIDRAHELRRVAQDAVRAGRLDGAAVQVGGISPTFADIQRIVARDFAILVIVTLLFILCVVLAVLRSLIAAITVVITVALSFATAIGLAVLIWQHLLGEPLYWATPPLAFIALVAVGSDYNLLFAARFREEAHAGLRTGIIRAYGGTGTVVTTAGCVFAVTMFAMLGSSLTNIMQMGSTVGIGLLVDTFVVRAIVVPAVASQLGYWFWWPIPRAAVQAGRRP
jgi:RND superfamily putative drug exporter